jgi:dihydrodipicolinate synthase/N-acetylneuraminate lyase
MPKRSRTARPHPTPQKPHQPRLVTKAHRQERDENQAAYEAVQKLLKLTGETTGKNPMAVALGRLGGLKGGRARAEKLTPEQRRKSAVNAAKARWNKG